MFMHQVGILTATEARSVLVSGASSVRLMHELSPNTTAILCTHCNREETFVFYYKLITKEKLPISLN